MKAKMTTVELDLLSGSLGTLNEHGAHTPHEDTPHRDIPVFWATGWKGGTL